MEYSHISELTRSVLAPDSWSVVVADVRDSTTAIRAGRQRDVNLVGTACIAAIRNHFAPSEVPYVFGGDGATFLISEDKLETCLESLGRIQNTARHNLRLDLRVGHVKVRELREKGGSIHIGYLKGSGRESFPYFRGNGVALADLLIKEAWNKNTSELSPSAQDIPKPDLSGLSCLHMPFLSQRGKILSVIVEFKMHGAAEDDALAEIFAELAKGGPLERLRPIQKENLRRAWLNDTWKTEAKLKTRVLSTSSRIVSRFLMIARHYLSNALFRLDVFGKAAGVNSLYTERLLQQSDWIKMDGALRLVIDVNEEESAQIMSLLERLKNEGILIFGIHSSDAAVMTCHLRSMKGQEHAHFIDGSEGGLTLAALQLKEQKKSML